QLSDNANDDTIVHHADKEPTKNVATTQKDKQPKKKKSRRKKWIIFFIFLFVIVASAIAALFILPSIFQPKDVVIPGVVELEYEEAVEILEEENLKTEQEFTNSDEIKEGLVVKTDPRAGRTVKEDTVVTVYVSEGKEKITFEDY